MIDLNGITKRSTHNWETESQHVAYGLEVPKPAMLEVIHAGAIDELASKLNCCFMGSAARRNPPEL
jgi:hypothetical protein